MKKKLSGLKNKKNQQGFDLNIVVTRTEEDLKFGATLTEAMASNLSKSIITMLQDAGYDMSDVTTTPVSECKTIAITLRR